MNTTSVGRAALGAALIGWLGLAAHTIAAAPPAPGAALNPAVIAADAVWFLQADFERLKEGQLGQAILKELEQPQFARPLEALQVALNFDPRRSLFNLTAYGPALNRNDFVLLAGGKLDTDQLQGLVTGAKEYQSTLYRSYVIHGWQNNRRALPDGGQGRLNLAVHTNGLILAGLNADRVKISLDVLDKLEPALPKDKPMLGFGALPEKTFLVLAANQPGDLLKQAPSVLTGFLGEMQALRLTAAEADSKLKLQLEVLATSEEMARNFQAILNGLKAALAMQKERPQLATLANALAVSQADNRAVVTLTSTPEDGMRLIKLLVSRRAGRAPER